MLELEGKELIHVERVREGCVMPTDKRRWQPCSFGTQSQANRVAIAGCHASGGWTRDRTYHTQASRFVSFGHTQHYTVDDLVERINEQLAFGPYQTNELGTPDLTQGVI